MRTGRVEANLPELNEIFKLPYIDELLQRKLAGPEHSTLPEADLTFYQSEYDSLRGELQAAHERSALPELPTARGALNDLLVRLRTR